LIIPQKLPSRQLKIARKVATKASLLKHLFLLLIVIFTHFIIYGQIDQKKLDSLEQAIESSTKAQKGWQDSFAKAQDSIYKSAISNSDSFKSSTQQTNKVKERQRVTVRIVIIVALFLTAVLIAFQRKNRST